MLQCVCHTNVIGMQSRFTLCWDVLTSTSEWWLVRRIWHTRENCRTRHCCPLETPKAALVWGEMASSLCNFITPEKPETSHQLWRARSKYSRRWPAGQNHWSPWKTFRWKNQENEDSVSRSSPWTRLATWMRNNMIFDKHRSASQLAWCCLLWGRQ